MPKRNPRKYKATNGATIINRNKRFNLMSFWQYLQSLKKFHGDKNIKIFQNPTACFLQYGHSKIFIYVQYNAAFQLVRLFAIR